MKLFLLCAVPAALGFSTTTSSPYYSPARSRPLLPTARRPYSSSLKPPVAVAATTTSTRLYNMYDDWAGDLLSSSQSEYTYDDLIIPLDEESIEQCLEELMDSEYGKTMFGRHDVPASVGITGSIEFVSLEGPEAILTLSGKFWHRRQTVLGKAAMYLNARMPELTSIQVSSPDEISDFEDVIDEFTGEVIYVEDKRSEDFNGDRATMEYQGLNPDDRGPFVFSNTGGMIRPA
ncbi:hypothetical protein ACHAXR_005181 [Thalassiosira sp. AJA248-18]